MTPVNVSITLDNARKITIETGKLARQADGSVAVRMGNAMFPGQSEICLGQATGTMPWREMALLISTLSNGSSLQKSNWTK